MKGVIHAGLAVEKSVALAQSHVSNLDGISEIPLKQQDYHMPCFAY